MGNLGLILLVAAFILTLIAAFWRSDRSWVWGLPHFGWLGLSLYLLSLLLR